MTGINNAGRGLRLYIDSADRREVERLLATGLFAGVTSNPAILDKVGLGSRDIPDFVRWSTEAGAKQVFAQSWGTSVEELVERGESIRALGTHVVVKVPASTHGIAAAARLSAGGPVLVTAVYSAFQLLPIIASGARYAAPFVGRMEAAGRAALPEVAAMQHVVERSGAALNLLAGSLRTPEQILELALAGVTHFTAGPAVWDAFFEDELTAASVSQFEELASR